MDGLIFMLGILESVSIGTPAITPDYIVSGEVNLGAGVEENFYQNPFPVISVGNLDIVFSFVTTDPAVLAMMQSNIVETITFNYKGTYSAVAASDLALTQNADTLTLVLSQGYIVDTIVPSADNASKTPGQYTVTIKACMVGTTEPTLTKTLTLAGA